jgi:dTDP-glucose pyrophosphorylase
MKEWASSGTYAFKSAKVLLQAIDEQIESGNSLNEEYYTSLTYIPILKKGKKVSLFPLQKFMQWGTPEDLEEFLYWSSKFQQLVKLELSGNVLGTAIVLAAGAGKRFVDMGYELPKPILPVSGSTVLKQVVKGLSASHNVIVGRADDNVGAKEIEGLCVRNGFGYLELQSLSSGQADTARFALEKLDLDDQPVTIAACDSLIALDATGINSKFERADVIVWIQKVNPYAKSKPEHFGWVRTGDSSDQIAELLVMEAPNQIDNWGSITGTFTFRTAKVAKNIINALVESNTRVNGELYLDSIVKVCLDKGIKILAAEPHFFVSLGTPAEYETFRYWQECFHKWLQHPYQLILDPYVEPDNLKNIESEWTLDPVGRRLIR